MSILVVGSVAFDDVTSPSGSVKNVLAGAATYFSLAASYFTKVRVVAVVGDDFGPDQEKVFQQHGIDIRGIERAKITYEIAPDLDHWGVEIIGKVKAWAKAISGPTSPPDRYPQLMNAPGSETGPGPQLVTWGKSTILSVDAHGFKFEYTLNSAKHIPFDWSGPG